MCAECAQDENTPASRSWFTWRDILHIVDIACCCAVLFPIIWSISHLRAAAAVSTPLVLGSILLTRRWIDSGIYVRVLTCIT